MGRGLFRSAKSASHATAGSFLVDEVQAGVCIHGGGVC